MKNKRHRSDPQQHTHNHGNSTLALISGMSLGAAIMYALDPDRGHRRRAMAQQRLVRMLRLAGESMDKGIRDLEHRVEGVIAEPTSIFRGSIRSGSRPEIVQENWAPGTRLLMGGLGLSLLLRGVRKPGLINSAVGLLGLSLVGRCARGTRIADEMLDAMRPAPGVRAGHRHPQASDVSNSQAEQIKQIPA